MVNRVALIIVAGLVVGGMALGVSLRKPAMGGNGTTDVVASFYPLRYAAEQIVGEKGQVKQILPKGAEPHDYELTPGDIQTLQGAEIILVNGNGLEPWAEKVSQEQKTAGKSVIVASEVASDSGTTREMASDPHSWLDPLTYSRIAAAVEQAVITGDRQNADYYKGKASELIVRLNQLDSDYRAALRSCKQRTLVTTHEAFGHLARRYGLIQEPITGLSPEAEPSPAQLIEVIELVKAQKLRYIFAEPGLSPKLAQTVAAETGAEVLELNPLESEEVNGLDYFQVMYKNLQNLRLGLDCP